MASSLLFENGDVTKYLIDEIYQVVVVVVVAMLRSMHHGQLHNRLYDIVIQNLRAYTIQHNIPIA